MRGRKAYFAITHEGERYHLDGDTLQWSSGNKPVSGELSNVLDTELMQGLAPIFAHLHGDYPEIEIEQGTFRVTPQRIWVSKEGKVPDHEAWGTLNALLLSRILYPPATPEEVLVQELRAKAQSPDKPAQEVPEPENKAEAPDVANPPAPSAPPAEEVAPPPPPATVPEPLADEEMETAPPPPASTIPPIKVKKEEKEAKTASSPPPTVPPSSSGEGAEASPAVSVDEETAEPSASPPPADVPLRQNTPPTQTSVAQEDLELFKYAAVGFGILIGYALLFIPLAVGLKDAVPVYVTLIISAAILIGGGEYLVVKAYAKARADQRNLHGQSHDTPKEGGNT